MSGEATLTIRCDIVDDGQRCDTEWGWPLPVQHHSELRALLKTRGWSYRRGVGDVCPDHGGAGAQTISENRDEIVDRLRAGESDRAIAAALHMRKEPIAAIRAELGVPVTLSGAKAASLADAFAARTEQMDGGHARWTGHINSLGTPCLIFQRRRMTAFQAAWELRTGRPPQGRLKAVCDMDGCVAPDHVDDLATRRRNARTYGAIFGEAV